MFFRTLVLTLSALSLAFSSVAAGAEPESDWSWNQPQAKVLPHGDLEWAPHPFRFEAGETVRYIDFENGSDGNPGTRERPWKRHPWDRKAGGRAVRHSGPTTYVFRRGVTYRGELHGKESGTAAEPIRLTSDPDWGQGEARFYGSRQITSGWQRGGHEDMPARRHVWYIDLKQTTPRHVWLVDEDGGVTPLLLARTPNWDRHADARDPQSQWWTWENPKWWEGDPVKTTVNGRKMHLGIDTKRLTREEDYYVGGLVWTEWGNMMGTPYPAEIQAYDPERKAIAYEGPWHRDSGTIRTGHMYYLEDRPHYLDEPGEFWFDLQGKGGRLYVRLPDDVDPNTVTIEVGDVINFIELENVSHIEVSGLVFRFGNVCYDLAARFFEHPDVRSGVVRYKGSGRDLVIRNNVFEHVSNGVEVQVANDGSVNDLLVCDNDIQFTDHHAINFIARTPCHNIRVMRNRAHETGRRSIRPKDNFTISLTRLQTAEIAGNIVTRAYAAGVNVVGGHRGKGGEDGLGSPMVRILVHHNRVVDSLLSANDWGGIETWQSGPFFTYNNVSGNPIGPFNERTFGFAYYMDGSFKNYVFNNIAWGTNNHPKFPLANYAAFQAIISYQNTLFNNTAYRFQYGSRRQAPQAGRDKYLGNIFQDISIEVFRHSDSKNEDPNAADAGQQEKTFAYHLNAYASNVLYDIGQWIGSFHALGGKYADLHDYIAALSKVEPMASSVGMLAERSPLRDPENGDFRLASGSAAIDRGVKVFVPWGLYAVVGEWNFTPRQDDPSIVVDEHFCLTGYHAGRGDYYKRPMYPLQGRNIAAEDFVDGPLENWIRGALRLDGQDQHLVVTHETLSEPFRYETGQGQNRKEFVAGPKQLQTPDIRETNFLIEAFVRVEPGDSGVLVSKRDRQSGYVLEVGSGGRLALKLYQNGREVGSRVSAASVADGQWHHLVAEVERGRADGLRIYVDGELSDGPGTGAAPGGSLANTGDFLVGGGPGLDHLACTIDFLRVSRGTLKDARTSIRELYDWQFKGPHLRDFTGREPLGAARDAGAIETE